MCSICNIQYTYMIYNNCCPSGLSMYCWLPGNYVNKHCFIVIIIIFAFTTTDGSNQPVGVYIIIIKHKKV